MSTTRTALPLAAGALFAACGVITLVHDQASPFEGFLDYALEGAFTAALVAAAAALWTGLREHGARLGWSVAAAGYAVLAVAAGVTFVRGAEALDPLFPLGVLAILAGTLGAAAWDLRGRVAPRGAGLLLLAGWVPAVALDTTLGLGLAWLGVAALQLRRAAADVPEHGNDQLHGAGGALPAGHAL